MKGQLKGSEQRQHATLEAASIIGTFVLNYMKRKAEKKPQLNEEESLDMNKRSASIGSEEATSVESESDEDNFALYTTDSPSGSTIERDDEFGSRSPSPISSDMDVLSNSASGISEVYISSDAESELDGEGLAENEDDSFVIHHNENESTGSDNSDNEADNFVNMFVDNNPLDNSDELNFGFIEASTETDAADESFLSQESISSLIQPMNLFGGDVNASGETDNSYDSF